MKNIFTKSKLYCSKSLIHFLSLTKWNITIMDNVLLKFSFILKQGKGPLALCREL